MSDQVDLSRWVTVLCPICSIPVPPTSSPHPRQFCSKPCASRSNSAAVNARHSLIDESAVVRLLDGSPVTSTKAERMEAARILSAHGYTLGDIAARLRTTARSVSRYRAELTKQAVAGGVHSGRAA